MLKNRNYTKNYRIHLSIFLFFLLGHILSGFAQNDSVKMISEPRPDKPWTVRKYSARLGVFWATNTTEIGAGLNGRNYSTFSFEDDLNMNRNTYSGLFNFTTRFGKHHRVDFSYYNIYRSTGTTIDKEIHFGEHVYPVNSDIKAHLNTNIFRLSYGYSFLTNSQWDVGALIGFHVMAFDIGIDLDGERIEGSYQDDVTFTAPLPDIGIYGTYALNDRWAFSTELSYFYLQYKTLTGRILNASLYAQYALTDRWEIDLGYTGFDVRVNLDTKRLAADFDWAFSGPFFNVAYKFGK